MVNVLEYSIKCSRIDLIFDLTYAGKPSGTICVPNVLEGSIMFKNDPE